MTTELASDHMQLILAGDLNNSVDDRIHCLRSKILLRYGHAELIVAATWAWPSKSLSDSDFDKIPSLGVGITKLGEKVAEQCPSFPFGKIKDTADKLIEERDTLVHGKMHFGPIIRADAEGSAPMINTTTIVMQKGDLRIPLDQDNLSKINKRLDRFFSLIKDLLIELDMDGAQLYIEPLDKTVDDTRIVKFRLRDLPKQEFKVKERSINEGGIKIDYDTVGLTWDAVPGAGGYRLEWRPEGSSENYLQAEIRSGSTRYSLNLLKKVSVKDESNRRIVLMRVGAYETLLTALPPPGSNIEESEPARLTIEMTKESGESSSPRSSR